MYHEDNDFGFGFFTGFFVTFLGIFVGGIVTFSGYDKDIEKKVVKECIEQPKVCKVKYDFFTLKGKDK